MQILLKNRVRATHILVMLVVVMQLLNAQFMDLRSNYEFSGLSQTTMSIECDIDPANNIPWDLGRKDLFTLD